MARIVVDLCNNHLGDRRIMEAMVEAAWEAGVDGVKTQTYLTSELNNEWPDFEKAKEAYASHQLQLADHQAIKNACEKYGLTYISTAFSLSAARFLDGVIKPDAVKIASPDCNNWPLIDYCYEHFPWVIISTGMHYASELDKLETFILSDTQRVAKTTLLHCVSLYPPKPQDLQLNTMLRWRNTGLDVGFSDHTEDIEAAKIAIAMGASMVERHFTLSRDLPGKDHHISSEPDEMAELVIWNDYVNLCTKPKANMQAIEMNRHYIKRWVS